MNANVHTMDRARPRASAIAVSNGKIIAVGTDEEIRRLAGSGTSVIDADGKLVLPGFNDSHVHFMALGNHFSSADMRGAKDAQEVLAKLEFFARFLPKGRWIFGSGLSPDIKLEVEAVDAVTPENPVLIYRTDPKTAFASTSAAKAASPKITAGAVSGNTLAAIRYSAPQDHTHRWAEIAMTASNYVASFGITSIQDTQSDDMAAVYEELDRKGLLKNRVYDCISLSDWAKLAAAGVKAATGNAMVRRGCLKGFYDPFDKDGEVTFRDIRGADRNGLQVAIHAIGREANAEILRIFERVIKENGPRDRRFRMEHAHGAARETLARFARAKIVSSMQPLLFFGDRGTTDEYRKLVDLGAPLAFGADAPMLGIDPIEGIYDAVNAGGGRGITVDEAVYAYTMGSAYAEFQEKVKGSIEPGKVADLVMLSADIFAPNADIRSAFVLRTFVNGRLVYENKIGRRTDAVE